MISRLRILNLPGVVEMVEVVITVLRTGCLNINGDYPLMTRINVVPPSELCDKHLLAEIRELPRIPNSINSGRAKVDCPKPDQYVLGRGHVSFFYNKLGWLHERYNALHAECTARGFKVVYRWPDKVDRKLYNYVDIVTPEALRLNRERIQIRMPKNAKWS